MSDNRKRKLQGWIRRKITRLLFIYGSLAILLVSAFAFKLIYEMRLSTIRQSQDVTGTMIVRFAENTLEQTIEDLKVHVTSQAWKGPAKESNLRYAGMSEAEIVNNMLEMDKAWAPAGADSPPVSDYLSRPLSVRLKDLVGADKDIAEIFVTDKYGALVASSGKTTDFYQADELWWQKTYAGGKGSVYVGDLVMDESTGITCITIAVPIFDEGLRVIGICNESISAREYFAGAEAYSLGKTGHWDMVNGEGKEIYSSSLSSLNSGGHSWVDIGLINSGKRAGFQNISAGQRNGSSLIYSVAPFHLDVIKDNGIEWYAVVSQSREEAFLPFKIIVIKSLFVIFALFIVIIASGVIIGNIFARPIQELSLATEKIMTGEKIHIPQIITGDEVEQLSEDIALMVEQNRQKQKDLEEAKKRIEDSASVLEDKVMERTLEVKRSAAAAMNMLEDLVEAKDRIDIIIKVWEDTFNSVDDIITVHDLDFRIVLANKAAETVFGRSARDIIGGRCYKLFHGKECPIEGCPACETFASGKSNVAEIFEPTLGKYLEVSTFPRYDLTDKMIGVVQIIRDITERKRADLIRQARIKMVEYEVSLTMSEFLQKCVDEAEAATGSVIGFYHIVDSDERSLMLQAWSTRTENVFCKAEGHGMHYDISKAGVWVDCVRQRKPIIHNDYESLPDRKGMPPGHAKVIREMVVPIYRENRIVAIIGVGNKPTNYTEKDIETLTYLADVLWELSSNKKAQQALRESEQKFRVFADFTLAWEYWLDPNGKIVYMSPSSESITGYRPDEFIADPELLEKIIHSDNEQVKELIHKSAHLISLEFRIETKDGRERYIAYVSKGAYTADGRYLGIRASATDITLRKVAERELWKAKAQAEIANQAKSQFLAHISHEIRTPLNAVIGFAEMLEGTPLNDVQKDYSNVIRTSGENLLALIGDILDISKIEAKQLTFEEIDFDLENMVESVIHMIMPKMKNSRVELEYDFADDVPRNVNGDPTRLRQVLLNLLVNSVKFTEEGEIRLSVSLDPQDAEGRTVRFSVKDTGIGIPKEKQEAIFDRFVQADASTTRKYGGAGLGLPISRSLLELMGGNLSVISEPGKGSEFIVTLKLNRSSSAIAEGLTPIPYGQLEGKKVAIVSESEKARLNIEDYCKGARMEIIYSGPSGEEAVQKIRGLSDIPQAIIYSSMTSIETGGREFVKMVRKRDELKNAKLVVVDPSAVPGAAKKAKDAGFDAYISKPVLRQNFIKIMQTVLGQGRAEGLIVTVHMAEDLSCKGIKVLIAEDISASQKLMSLIMKRLGCEADIVANGEEAVEKLKKGAYDIVLMDVQMPVMDGIEATKAIRGEVSRTIPIIALTAAAMEDDRAKSMGAGMNDYLTKPVKADELKKKLLAWTGRGGGRII